jgi:prepilin-type N-terminal cleavage/methylation domain-containing protein
MRRTIKKQKGFTLLELLMAMMLLAIGLLATASMQGTAIHANSLSNRLSVATTLAQQVAEEITSLSKTNTLLRTASPPPDVLYPTLDPVTPSSDLFVPGAGTFRARYQIIPNATTFGGVSIKDTTQIHVDVYFVSPDGVNVPKIVAFTTYKGVQ